MNRLLRVPLGVKRSHVRWSLYTRYQTCIHQFVLQLAASSLVASCVRNCSRDKPVISKGTPLDGSGLKSPVGKRFEFIGSLEHKSMSDYM